MAIDLSSPDMWARTHKPSKACRYCRQPELVDGGNGNVLEFPDPNCVRCHGTGKPVPGYSVVMLQNPNRFNSIPVRHAPSAFEAFRYTNEGARAAAWARKRQNGKMLVMCVVNVYPKRKPDILASLVGPDDANMVRGTPEDDPR